ncbi:sigma factor-like helix-turn-helix DNA-binding protein [Eisenbergiella sp.]
MTQEQKLICAIAGLKEREKALIFGRVFEELEFEELGKRHGISGKQAEMAYYYAIRKIRKGMEGTKDGI